MVRMANDPGIITQLSMKIVFAEIFQIRNPYAISAGANPPAQTMLFLRRALHEWRLREEAVASNPRTARHAIPNSCFVSSVRVVENAASASHRIRPERACWTIEKRKRRTKETAM